MSREERGQTFLAELSGIRAELPFDPELLRRLFEITEDRSLVSLEELAKTIQKDQGLTTRILSLANSAFYGLQSQVTSVSRAVSILGIKEIRNLVLVASIQGLTKGKELKGLFDLHVYWKHQLETAQASKWLAVKLGSGDPDILFTAGLLHDLGKLLVAIYRPEDWKAISDRAAEQRRSFPCVEDEYWGLEHGLIGAMTLAQWNLPPALVEPVNWHHAPDMAPENAKQALTVCLADALSHLLTEPDFPLHRDPADLLDKEGLDLDEAKAEFAEVLNEQELLGFIRLMC